MVDIISKQDGPRREDVRARQIIDSNQGAITRIADQLSQGAYSANKRAQALAAKTPPAPQGRQIYAVGTGASTRSDPPDIRIKVSVNNRVVAYDSGTGKQLHLLGEIRRLDGVRYFALASRENGFFAGLPDDVNGPIAELDGQIIDEACPESLLASDIAARLGIGQPGIGQPEIG